MNILNLGSGALYVSGQLNVDLYADRVDVRHDLNVFPYPFANDTFDDVRCMNIIEHLDDPIAVMSELHRIARNGALVTIRVPHFRSASLYEDITHRRGYAWRTFDHFTSDVSLYGNYTSRGYEMISREYTPYLFPWIYKLLSRVPVLTDNFLSKYVPMASILFVLKVKK